MGLLVYGFIGLCVYWFMGLLVYVFISLCVYMGIQKEARIVLSFCIMLDFVFACMKHHFVLQFPC